MPSLLELASKHHAELTEIRRDIHAHPELGFEESRTVQIVTAKLDEWGIEYQTGIGRNGVVATIRGSRPGNSAIALRCDMDALALTEANDFPYASKTPGVMHACGHDGHTTMLLGAARMLAETRDFAGTVYLIFQPAEEGRGGAVAMLEDSLFSRFPADRIYGMHTLPGMPVGQFGTRAREFMSGAGWWRVEFKGSGGHGGMSPHLANDLVVAQAGFVNGLQTIVSRSKRPTDIAIISVGYLSGGDAEALNVMPSTVVVAGTMRAFKQDVQDMIVSRIEAHAKAQAALVGASVEITHRWDATPLVNDPFATQIAVSAATSVVGEIATNPEMEQLTVAEDFAWMLRQKPGAYIFLGNGEAHGQQRGGLLHTPTYDFNDDAIPFGVAYWLAVVERELGSI